MSTQKEYEAANVTAPLKNSNAMKCIAVLGVSEAVQTADLAALFGSTYSAHYYTARADGVKVYLAFGSSAGTIDEAATGNGNTVAWPVADGENLPLQLLSGKEVATGVGTLVNYNILHYKTATGMGTGYLRIYRSSVGPNQGSEAFKAP